jgi:vitamin B12 transporter
MMKQIKMTMCLFVSILALVFLGQVQSMAAGQMDTSQLTYNIEAQNLKSALEIYQKTSGLNLAYSDDLVQGKMTDGVYGKNTTAQALKKILKDTGLTYTVTNQGTVVLRKHKMVVAQREVEKREPAEEREEVKRPVEMEQMVVTATKSKMNVREIPASVSVVTAEDIELMPVAHTFHEVLRFTPGVYLDKCGAIGSPTIKVRGQAPAILVNGREMSQFFGYPFYGGLIEMDAVERIEVIRGPQSAVHGSKAISGVINIITKKGDKENPYVKTNALAGEGRELRGGLSLSGGYDKLSYFLAGSGSNQDEAKTPRGTLPDEYESRDVYARLDYDLNDHHALTLEYIYGKVRSLYHMDLRHEYYTRPWRMINEMNPTEIEAFYLSYNGKIADWFSLYADFGLGKYDNESYSGKTAEDYYDPARRIYTKRNEDNKWGEVRGRFDILADGLLTATAGAQYKESDLDFREINPSYSSDNKFSEKEKYIAPYLQVQSKPIEYLFLSAGIRHDSYSYSEGSDKDKTSPKIGLSVFPFVNTGYDWTTLWAAYSEGFRAPRANEMYFPGAGNPDLEPEETEGWDFGLKQRVGLWANIEFTYFDTDYTNKIQYDRALRKFNNIGEATGKGYELLAEVYPAEFLRLFVTYTELDQRDTKADKDIYGDPGEILTLGLSVENLYGVYFSLTGFQNNDWHYNEPYKHPSEGDWLWNTKLSYHWNVTNKALFIPFISIENLADKEYYPGSLIAEGRAWHVGASLKVNF